MKKWIALIAVAAAPLLAADSGAMTPAERTYLLEQLEQSKKGVLASIEGLSEAQWKFKPAPNVWSVAECAEHIVLAEDYMFGATQQILKSPAVDRLPSATAEDDHKFVAMIQDRSKKATAPEPITPTGRIASPADAIREFTAKRDKTIAYVKSTNDPLRAHAMDGPVGKMDDYQFLLLLASHSARHTAQIREVQSNAAYPKATP